MKKNNTKDTYSLKNLFLYFLVLGALGYGGAFALVNIIHRDLVERKKWITEEEFKHGLAFTQFSPGPLVTQLSMYIGYLKQNILGATVAGLGFIITPFLLVVIISIFYTHYGNLPWMTKLLYGISASVMGIITASVYMLIKKTIKKKLLWAIVAFVFIVSFVTSQTNYLLFIGAGILTLLFYTKKIPGIFAISYIPLPIIPTVINFPVLLQLFTFFLSAGALAFGGGLAILPYLQTGVVSQHHWLTNKQFLDAVAVAMITPGPVVITSVFIGYLVGKFPGALIASLGMFLPVYLIVIVLTPVFKKHAQNEYVKAFVDGVIAAAMGAICSAIITLGKESIVDGFTVLLAVGSFISVKFFKIPSVIVVIAAGVLGLLLSPAH